MLRVVAMQHNSVVTSGYCHLLLLPCLQQVHPFSSEFSSASCHWLAVMWLANYPFALASVPVLPASVLTPLYCKVKRMFGSRSLRWTLLELYWHLLARSGAAGCNSTTRHDCPHPCVHRIKKQTNKQKSKKQTGFDHWGKAFAWGLTDQDDSTQAGRAQFVTRRRPWKK